MKTWADYLGLGISLAFLAVATAIWWSMRPWKDRKPK